MMGSDEDGKAIAKIEVIEMQPVSVALIREGSVQGYIIVEPAFSYLYDIGKNSTIPLELVFQDALTSAVFNNDEVDVDRLDKLQLEGFRTNIKDRFNDRYGSDVLAEVFIRRVDFISVDAIRDRKLRAG